jgi:Deoxynucleoside kinase
MTFIVSIESPLGGGKGFFLKYIMKSNILSKFIVEGHLQDDSISHVMDMNNDAKRWALFTELDFLIRHVMGIKKCKSRFYGNSQNHLVLIEGSPITDKLCYVDNSTDIDPLEKELYNEWFDILKPQWHIDMSVFLKSSVHSHFDRVMGNSKKEQAFVTLSYLSGKMIQYEQTLQGCVKLICENNFEDNEPVMRVMAKQFESICRQKLLLK